MIFLFFLSQKFECHRTPPIGVDTLDQQLFFKFSNNCKKIVLKPVPMNKTNCVRALCSLRLNNKESKKINLMKIYFET